MSFYLGEWRWCERRGVNVVGDDGSHRLADRPLPHARRLLCYRSVRLVVRSASPLRLTARGARGRERRGVGRVLRHAQGGGRVAVAPGAPTDAFNRAEATATSRASRLRPRELLECADPEAPRLAHHRQRRPPAPVKLGSDSPDNLYENATIDDRLEYVVSGTRGLSATSASAPRAAATAARAASRRSTTSRRKRSRTTTPRARLHPRPLAVRPEGAVNWLELRPTLQAMFIVRQTFALRPRDAGGAAIARRAPTGGAAATSPSRRRRSRPRSSSGIAEHLLVAGASNMFAKWAHGSRVTRTRCRCLTRCASGETDRVVSPQL